MKSLEGIKQKYETFADNHPRAIKLGKIAIGYGLDVAGARYGLSGKASPETTIAAVTANFTTNPSERNTKAMALGLAADHLLTFTKAALADRGANH